MTKFIKDLERAQRRITLGFNRIRLLLFNTRYTLLHSLGTTRTARRPRTHVKWLTRQWTFETASAAPAAEGIQETLQWPQRLAPPCQLDADDMTLIALLTKRYSHQPHRVAFRRIYHRSDLFDSLKIDTHAAHYLIIQQTDQQNHCHHPWPLQTWACCRL